MAQIRRADLSVYSKYILALGAVLILVGLGLRLLNAQKGTILLEQGKRNTLVLKGSGTDSLEEETGLGLFMTLDSLSVEPHDPVFEIRIQQDVEGPEDSGGMGSLPVREIVDRYPLAPMKTRMIGNTDFRFRVKEFYPDFTFSYQYPDQRDTIAPKVTGMLLDLRTPEGPAIVTLRSDQPNRHTLGDVVGLGTSFTFFWELAEADVTGAISSSDTAACKIVFSGADQQMHYIQNDTIRSFSFVENQFYPVPGKDSFGFKVLYAFPDIDLLKAVPSTRSPQPLHPVAGVEVWKKNGPGQEAYLYPAVRGRIGGQFSIQGTGYSLAMELDPKEESRHCQCWITVSDGSEGQDRHLQLSGKNPVTIQGYRFSIEECRKAGTSISKVQVRRQTGYPFFITGVLLTALSVIVWVFRSVPQVVPPEDPIDSGTLTQ